MRIAYYSHYFAPEIGAPSARIYDFARQWGIAGHEVEVVTCFPNHPAGRLYPGYVSRVYMRENIDGIDTHRHWTYVTPNKGILKKTIGHLSYLPSALLVSNRRVPAPGIVIGTSPTFFAAEAAAAMARRAGVPFVMEVRDLWPAVFVDLGIVRSRSLIRLLEAWELSLYRRAAKVVTVTESFRQNLISRGIPAGKVVTILNGADMDFWIPSGGSPELRRQLGLDDSFIVLYIGALGISHALESVLQSARMLLDQPYIHFLFVGEGAEKERLTTQATRDGLRNVTFLDPTDRAGVREYYALADVCLVPLKQIAIFDTFVPSKIFEILAMGRPIVGSLRGEAAGILRNSGAALVVEPEDTEAIARSVLFLRDHPDEARAMGRRGHEFVDKQYSRRSLACAYLETLKAVVEEHGSLRP